LPRFIRTRALGEHLGVALHPELVGDLVPPCPYRHPLLDEHHPGLQALLELAQVPPHVLEAPEVRRQQALRR
jgi:hypothetical protein